MITRKLRFAALTLAAAAVLVSPASALADGDDDTEGTPAPWTYNPGQASGWTYNPGEQLQPTNTVVWNPNLKLCQLLGC